MLIGFQVFLDYLNQNFRDNQTEELILVGPSMGGIITRLALDSLESIGHEPHVKMWFSFDSPQEGANISLGLQYGVNYLQNRPIIDILSNGALDVALASLSSLAAQQMLIDYYGYNNPELNESQANWAFSAGNTTQAAFYNTLRNTKKYPLYSKNIAISNGGTGLLYPDASPNLILDFHKNGQFGTRVFQADASGYRQYTDANASHELFYGHFVDGVDNDYTLNLTGAIAYDNAPGGYTATLYTFNMGTGSDGKHTNDHWGSCGNVWNQKSTFMPTVSAFGIIPTADNVHKTWDQIDVSETPFDYIHGMTYYGNEEHVRVTDRTSDWLQGYLVDQRAAIQKPFPRSTPYTETESMPCLYTATSSATFGGVSGCIFTIKSGADVKVAAPSIKFKPGFKVENGAHLSAKCGTVVNGSAKAAFENINPSVTYLIPSPYNSKIYDYSEKDGNVTEIVSLKIINDIHIYPNPARNMVNIEYKSTGNEKMLVGIKNIFGQTIKYCVFSTSQGIKRLDVSSFAKGIYIIKVDCGNKSLTQKLIIE
jgi:hypothetical protein